MTQGRLIDKLRRRDEAAYIYVIEKYSRLLWRVAYEILSSGCDMADAEDCIAEVFFKLWQNPQAYDETKSKLKNYLVLMTRSRAIDMYRSRMRRREAELNEDIVDGENDPAEAVLTQEKHQELNEALNGLSAQDSEIIERRFLRDEKPAEISEKMKLPVRKVENRLYRAKQALKAKMGGTSC